MLSWNERYSVNIKEIDEQHQQLINYINELEQAMRMGVGAVALDSIYVDLMRYAQTHFALEERLMREHSFPDYDCHAREHAQFVKKVTEMDDRFKAGDCGLTVRTLSFLCDWLSHHIMEIDKNYSAYLNERGVH